MRRVPFVEILNSDFDQGMGYSSVVEVEDSLAHSVSSNFGNEMDPDIVVYRADHNATGSAYIGLEDEELTLQYQ